MLLVKCSIESGEGVFLSCVEKVCPFHKDSPGFVFHGLATEGADSAIECAGGITHIYEKHGITLIYEKQ